MGQRGVSALVVVCVALVVGVLGLVGIRRPLTWVHVHLPFVACHPFDVHLVGRFLGHRPYLWLAVVFHHGWTLVLDLGRLHLSFVVVAFPMAFEVGTSFVGKRGGMGAFPLGLVVGNGLFVEWLSFFHDLALA